MLIYKLTNAEFFFLLTWLIFISLFFNKGYMRFSSLALHALVKMAKILILVSI